jgi:regulator of cell morphogenesis and NO signaling
MNLLDQPLGELARDIPGATRIFNEHGLDFCCGGHVSLRAAATIKDFDPEVIAARLQQAIAAAAPAERDWNAATPGELVEHIVSRYHDTHREQLPELVRLAHRVETVHGEKPECPRGLGELLERIQEEMESHMQKEEQVLFPLFARGLGAMASGPIAVMRMEHEQHGENLQQMATLTNDITLPAEACNTWRALYLGLRTLREDLMEHIHLENNILFAKGAAARPFDA